MGALEDSKKLNQVGALVENVFRAQFEQFSTRKLVGHPTEDNGSAGQLIALDRSKNVNSPHFWHPNVQTDDIWLEIVDGLERFDSVARRAYNFQF
jgi:hypothetical protein